MMKTLKRFLAIALVMCMMLTIVPFSAFAEGTSTINEATTASTDDDFQRILHLDCGRKYFTKDWIIALINEMAAAGYTHLQLAFGNDGLRFLLDDMSVGSYSDDAVTAAIQAGNIAYYDAGDVNELTESEMDEIITHANSVGIKIIPLLNTPGHMDTVVSAINSLTDTTVGYAGSGSTIDLENTTAVTFVTELVGKYITYFKNKGCTEFNMGADEYANDVYSTGSMGFGALVSAGKYQLFVDYVNEMAEQIKNAGMTPVAFNDGIYFNNATSYTFDTNITVAFWTSGWSGYQSASASTMASKGHPMINVHGDFYYVLGKTDNWDSNGYTYASNWDNNTFMSSTVSDPVGAMFCIWCDYPDAETENQIAANTRLILRAMAAEMNDEDSSAISTDVVAGGFNEDGTINVPETETVTDSETGISVSADGVTAIEVEQISETTTTNGASQVWNIKVNGGAYTGSATVKIPYDSIFDGCKYFNAYMDGDPTDTADISINGNYFVIKVPHFSTLTIDGSTTQIVNVELAVGEIQTITDTSGNYKDAYDNATTGKPDTSIATVTVEGKEAVTGTTVSTAKATELEAGATYIMRVYGTSYALSSNTGRGDWGTQTLAFETNNLTANTAHLWTLEASGDGYKLKSAAGYLNLGTDNNTAYVAETGEVFTITSTSTGWTIKNPSGEYINALGGLTTYYSAGGWTGDGTRFDLYKVTEATEASTEITFKGESVGETSVTVGNVTYKIVVSKAAITDIVTVDTYKTYTDNSTNVTVDDPTVASATLSDGTLTITGLKEGSTTVTTDNAVYTITVTKLDLTTVTPLEIEYFITNQTVTIDGVTYKTLYAVDVYSEAGVAFADLVPASDNAENPKVLWRGWLLPDGYHQEGENDSPDMCTDSNGTRVEKIRYWNGAWQYFDGTEWITIKDTDQIVAYYLQQTEITDEVTTDVTDWGQDMAEWKEGVDNSWFWGSYVENGSKYIFMDFAVVYEDGTQVPGSDEFPVDDTWFFHFDVSDGENRVMKPIVFEETADYEIWKVTVTDGTSTGYSSASTFESEYDDTTETIVWTEEMGGKARIEDLTYTANRSGKLIRVYVRAVETEDSLTVVYYDEKFGDTLYEYNITVKNGTTFSAITPTPGTFYDEDGNTIIGTDGNNRITVKDCGIVNALNKTQNFQTDLTLVPEAVGKYKSELYEYTGSEISEDGKTLYLYYNINTNVLSPNFVIDFGLPFTFNLSDVTNTSDLVESVTASARYGTVEYNSTNKTFTYTPTTVLLNVDVLSINILFDGASAATLSNVGVTPATTVHYEASFLENENGWSVVSTSSATQTAEVLGKKVNNYGYEPNYIGGSASTSSAIGSTTDFTFTGTGVDIYANCLESTGYVAIRIKNAETGTTYLVNTVAVNGTTGATNGQSTINNAPIVSVRDLTHGTYTVTITKVMDTNAVNISGFRVYNTIKPTGDDTDVFIADKEDNPNFYELRDEVLDAIKITDDTSDDYGKLAQMSEQVYNELTTNASATIVYSDYDATEANAQQDLLDNGPKNELLLLPKDGSNYSTLIFSITTSRDVQVGLKAPNGETSYTITETNSKATGASGTIKTSVDMFYDMGVTPGTETTYTFTITNTGDNILSVTLLKVCDDPSFALTALTAESIESALRSMGYEDEPEVVLADATLTVDLVDYTGKVLATDVLTANGVEGESVVFSAEAILALVEANIPAGYAIADTSAVSAQSVTYGESEQISVQIGKVATLKIYYVSIFGKKIETITITKVQTESGYWTVNARDIKAAAPEGSHVIWRSSVKIPYGKTVSVFVPTL